MKGATKLNEQDFIDEIKKYKGLMFHISYGMLYNIQDCEDAVQESIFKAWQSINKLNSIDSFKPWLIRILINTCNDILRKNKFRNYQQLDENIPAVNVQNNELHDAIKSINPKLSIPIILFYMEGFTLNEISMTLKIPEGTVKSRLSRAKKKLEKILSSEEEYYEFEYR